LSSHRSATPSRRRLEYWERAREEYSQALAAWLEIAGAKALEGDDAERPGTLREAIARCDEALARLGAP
jgi:hypothetical protein